jgi:hypothetical protein
VYILNNGLNLCILSCSNVKLACAQSITIIERFNIIPQAHRPRPQGGDLDLGDLGLNLDLTDLTASTSPISASRRDLDLGDLDLTLDLGNLVASISTLVT